MLKVTDYLKTAQSFIDMGAYRLAVDCLVAARNEARTIGTVKGKIAATQCVIALDAILPLAVEQCYVG